VVKRWGALGALLVGALGAGAPASGAEEPGSLHDLITVLHERGVIDEGDYASIAAKNAAYEAEQREAAKPALSFWGDFRFRSESLFFEEDETGSERTDRHRLRYRIRLNREAEITDHAEVYVRFTSGADDPRSANQTLGSSLDFDTDDFRIDRAYARVSPFAHGRLGEDGTLHFELGKVPNPFQWKVGRDNMLWDNDITLEGATARLVWDVSSGLETFLTTGYYVIDENSTSKDPHLAAGQAGFHARPGASVAFGGRASYYHFNSLDAAFHARGVDGTGGVTSAGGNIVDGLTGGVGGQNLQVVEAAGYLEMLTDTAWPMLVYATWSNNLTAEPSVVTAAEEDDTAWGVGVEMGDKKKLARLGAGYWRIEANAFPSQFIDSNLFDGFTNRRGWVAYASRSLWKNTDVNVTAFFSDEIRDDVPPYGDSVPDAERIRRQADLVFKFE